MITYAAAVAPGVCPAIADYPFDLTGNRKLGKRPGKSTGRIDGMVSLLAMATRRSASAPTPRPDLNRLRKEQGEAFVI